MSAIVGPILFDQNSPPVCLGNENSNELDHLWWVMHQSDDASRQTAAVTFYLDESGTHRGAPVAVMGGLLLNKSRFRAFTTGWDDLLVKYSIQPPLHMKDFRRPDGRLADVSNQTREALFAEAVPLLNTHKIYSIAGTLTAEQLAKYHGGFPEQSMTMYGMCFLLSAYMNHRLAKQNHYKERIAFLMHSGNQYAEHVRSAHAGMQTEEWLDSLGSLTFDSDKRWRPLQGADLIAWASRVKGQGDSFTNGYEPLEGIFDQAHCQEFYPDKAIAELSASLEKFHKSIKFRLS